MLGKFPSVEIQARVLLSFSRAANGVTMRRRLPRHMSADYVESLNEALAATSVDTLTLDLTQFRRSRLFGEARLLGVLALASRRGTKVHLALGAPLPSAARGTSKYWKVFCESISGLVMGQLATRIVDPSDHDYSLLILARQADALRQSGGLIGSGKEVAGPVVDRFGGPPSSRVVTSDNALGFTALFRELLFRHFYLPRLNDVLVNTLSEFAFEALQNTRDHGTSDLDGEPIGGIRFLSLRRINLSEESLAELIGQESTPVSSYLEALREDLASTYRQPDHLVEMTVADSGIGIPARMAGSMAVHAGALAEC